MSAVIPLTSETPADQVTGAGRVDHTLVRRLRTRVAELLSDRRRADDDGGRLPLDPADERAYARSLVVQVLEDHARAEVAAGRTPLSAVAEERHAAAVVAALFGVGRLQPLLEDPDVENIDINGSDRVFVSFADGREELAEPVADDDEDLVELVQVLAASVGLASRPFDTANPQLDLRLPDGSRLSAVMGVCRRPALSIRRARLSAPTLGDLVASGTLTPEVAEFLRAAVRARKNIMIAGSTNSGKTTMLRALAAEIPAAERLITIERALELGLETQTRAHPNCIALEERLPNAEGRGAVPMAELVRRSLRMNPSRVVVGEVLGDEIVSMLNAMSQGNDGSLSTIHANSATAVFDRISTYALQAAERLPIEATHHLVAGALDLVVFLRRTNSRDGRVRRRVESIREITGVDGRVLSSEVFATTDPDRPAGPATPPACAADLEAVGWDGWDAWLPGVRR